MAKQETYQSTQTSERSNTTPNRHQAVAPALEENLPRMVGDLAKAQPSHILQLQRMVGNRTTAAMIQQQTRTATVQPKLTVGPAHDRYEREADQTAKQVMRMKAPAPPSGANRPSANIQPATIQRTGKSSADGFEVDKNFTQQLNTSKGGGKPLPDQTRSFMESRFNADFSGVRVHTDNSAAQLNHNIQAKAFTHGNNIYFNRGNYSPGTGSGKQLLAHELTHVVQQGAAVQRAQDEQTTQIQRKHDNLGQSRSGAGIKSTSGKKKFR